MLKALGCLGVLVLLALAYLFVAWFVDDSYKRD